MTSTGKSSAMPHSPTLVRLRPFLLLAVLAAVVLYYSYPSALRLHRAGYFLLARPLYLISAVAGNHKAQHNLATMYIEGEGGPPNPATAAYWYDKAAKQGSSMSAEALGALYLEGDGLDTDPVKAVALFEQAANQGEPNSIVLLGELYAEGLDGLPRNGKQARYWFQQGADRDLPAAQYGLATLHASGELIPRDLKQAEFWYLKAARRGHAKAQLELGLLYLNQPGSSVGLKGAQVWLTEASRQEETAAAARNHLARLCRANPALNCQLSSAGPSLGALLPPAARRRL